MWKFGRGMCCFQREFYKTKIRQQKVRLPWKQLKRFHTVCLSTLLLSCFFIIGKKDKRQSPKKIANSRNKALRRSHRESRKFFESLNENTLVRGLVVDYLHPEQTSETCKKDGEHVDDGETDSQPEVSAVYKILRFSKQYGLSNGIRIIIWSLLRNQRLIFPRNHWNFVYFMTGDWGPIDHDDVCNLFLTKWRFYLRGCF